MHRLSFTALFLLLLVGPVRAADHPVGYTEIAVAHAARPLTAHLWYPASATGAAESIGESPAFYGVSAIVNAPVAAGRFPLVVLSHGLGGNWRNQSWLAGVLAGRGMIVASIDHPGTTTRDMASPQTARLWERPGDITRTITALLDNDSWRPQIDAGHIAVIGHSLGGYTAMAVGGARYDAARFVNDCSGHEQAADCRWYRQHAVGTTPDAVAALDASLADPRVTAVVSLDLGFAQGFRPESLANYPVPVLVIGAGAPNPILPVARQSRYLADLLPAGRVRYEEVADAGHFSFLGLCKPEAAALLAAGGSGDEIVCAHGGGRSRAALHTLYVQYIVSFLRDAGFP